MPKTPSRRPRDEDEMENPAPKRSRDEDDEETPERRPPSRVRSSRDEDDAPRRRTNRDRDEDERPIRKRKPEKEGMSTGLLVGIGGGALLLVSLLIGGVVLAFRPSASATNSQVSANPVGINTRPILGVPQNPPPVVPAPAGPAPAGIAAADLDRVKKATVYLRVAMSNGGVAEGTGFFAVEPGVIVTNAHVLGMLSSDSVAPKSVAVSVHSGEREGFQLNGVILGVDRANDLAVLRVAGDRTRLPMPLRIGLAEKIIETQKVFIFGFPLGAQLGKNITVSESSVSSLRRTDSGVLHQVQVNGGMHPGNSGGPVTDTLGVVVGVSVAGIPGTQINFAIPAEVVTRALAGSVSDHDFGTPYAGIGGKTTLPVFLATLDPLQRIREIKFDVWSGPAGDNVPAADKEPQGRPGDGPRQRVTAATRSGGFAADIVLPPLPLGQVYWSRPVVTDAAGVTTWAAGRAVPFDPAVVIERRPAELKFKVPTATIQRTLHIRSNSSITYFTRESADVMSNKMDGYMLEESLPDTRGLGTGVRIHLAQPQFSREGRGRVVRPSDSLTSFVSLYTPTYLVTGNNSIREFGRPTFEGISPDSLPMITHLFETVCNTWEATALPFPNRTVRPQETWRAHVPMLLTLGRKKEARALELTCTYEGARTVNGVNFAHVQLAGIVQGTGDKRGEVYGKVAGHAIFNVDAQLLAQVKTTISYEVDTGESGLRILVSDESVIDREDGNTKGIVIPERLVARMILPPGWGYSIAKNQAFSVFFPDSALVLQGTEESTFNDSPIRLSVRKSKGQAKGGPNYAASVASVSPVEPPDKLTPAEKRLDWYRDTARAKDKLLGDKRINMGRAPGREFTIERPNFVVRYRVYAHPNKFYVVSVLGTKEQVRSKDADTFLDSFTLPPSVTGPLAPPPKSGEKGK